MKDSFYLCEVNEFLIAKEKSFDAYQHYVLAGTKYFSCNYLKVKEGKSRKIKNLIQYEKLSQPVIVLPEHILLPYVEITEDYKLSMDEKQWLDDCT